MAEYKLYYFNARGRAELCRLILKYADVPFEDVRIEREEWPERSKEMPFGQIPVLEVNGKKLSQSLAIARFLARKHGLAGKCDWQSAVADMYADSIQDLIAQMYPVMFEKDADKQKVLAKAFVVDKLMPFIAKVESHLKCNGNSYLTGHEITWADLALFNFVSTVMALGTDKLDSPRVTALMDNVAKVPAIKKWIQDRPVTPM